MTQNSSMYMKRVRGRRYDYSDDKKENIEVYLITDSAQRYFRPSPQPKHKHRKRVTKIQYKQSSNDRHTSTEKQEGTDPMRQILTLTPSVTNTNRFWVFLSLRSIFLTSKIFTI